MSTSSTGTGRSAEQRRKRAAELREQQLREERRRRTTAIAAIVVGVLVVVGGVGGLIAYQKSGGSSAGGQVVPTTPTGAVTKEPAPTQVKDDSGIQGVLAWNTGTYPGTGSDVGAIGHDHVAGPVQYAVVPPVGGPHNGTWMNAGVYTKPIPSERAVHNLEHGAVWITYRPGLAASEVSALRTLVHKQSLLPESAASLQSTTSSSNRFVDLSPWKDASLPSPIVISSWGHQLRVDSASDPRLQKFIDTFRVSKKYTPEYGPAVDGVPVSIGGRPAADGGSQPNPN
ncbi:uncharacterized protein DUF3105 [Motilibacter rhizosphaerae]|uniref:Uncharacterized protein DUF3105 n=1 Tax=Motilibacter rhizosphaerae TaxID=598652 RepID=A0A4Q7NA73_9ACTN|nr:DUF3105 domain-containing protein [Motilibacter rhizosphaerae]RZS79023.1 uncharacterized protein DUF3105 [Motilibacter rhizosphaerae]